MEFYVDRFFSFSTLKMLLQCLRACFVSDEKSAVILIFVPLHVTRLCLKIFSLSQFLNNLIMICLGGIFFMFLCLEFIEFLGSVGFKFSSNLENF